MFIVLVAVLNGSVNMEEQKKNHCKRHWYENCERTFNDLTGTAFADTHIDLKGWVYVMDELSELKSLLLLK